MATYVRSSSTATRIAACGGPLAVTSCASRDPSVQARSASVAGAERGAHCSDDLHQRVGVGLGDGAAGVHLMDDEGCSAGTEFLDE